MKPFQLNPETYLFEFDELPGYLTYVAALIRNQTLYLIDTFLGPDAIKSVMIFLKAHFSYEEIIVINTHYHFDHIWGNNYFAQVPIIAHQKCAENISAYFLEEYQQYASLSQGKVTMRLPDITFETSFYLGNDLTAFYSPGHTNDSISVYDAKNEILFAGDNLEKPLLHTESKDLKAYLQTLKQYQACMPKMITAGHTKLLDMDDLKHSIAYLEALSCQQDIQLGPEQWQIHQENLRFLQKK